MTDQNPDDPLDWTDPTGENDEDLTYLTEAEQAFLNELGDRLAEHEVRLEKLEDQKEKKAETRPKGWIERNSSREAWEELAQWVDWLNASYSMPDEMRVPECWPAHPGLVHVLAGLRSAWRGCVIADTESDEQGNAMASFHDYHLFPFFSRLNSSMYACANGHQDDVIHEPTDRRFFPPGLEEPDPSDET